MNKLLCFICVILTLQMLHGNLENDKTKTNRKKALIFGVSGQDGNYLAEFLLNKNYEVHGVGRNLSRTLKHPQFAYLFDHPQFHFHVGDLTNHTNLLQLIGNVQPDEIYNLAAQTNVKVSFNSPEETAQINALGTLNILQSVRLLGLSKQTKFFQASSSEIFGQVKEQPQTESTPFYPCSPYGVAKLYSYWISVNYRESYGIFACNGILFNHESPLRSEEFVTRKITRAACRYKLGLQKMFYLGNLDSKRDWGYAKDYVEAMWLMLQQDQPQDFVIATGEAHSVREFVELAFKEVGIEIEWQGQGVEECGIDKATQEVIIKVDPQFYRPSEVHFSLGDIGKAGDILQWKPKTIFNELIKIMIEADFKIALVEKNQSIEF